MLEATRRSLYKIITRMLNIHKMLTLCQWEGVTVFTTVVSIVQCPDLLRKICQLSLYIVLSVAHCPYFICKFSQLPLYIAVL